MYFINPQGDAMAMRIGSTVEVPLVEDWRDVFTILVASGDTTRTLQKVYFKHGKLTIDTTHLSVLPDLGTMARVNDVVFVYEKRQWHRME